MHRMNPYRRRPTRAADQYLEFEEYEDDDPEGVMSEIALYELNPAGLGRRQRSFGAGGGYADDRGGWHPGGGRYLDPRYLPADYPDGAYHPGGGQVSRGYHPGGGYYSNPYGGMLDDGGYQSPWDQNPPGLGPRQRSFGAGGGYADDRGGWHPGGGRYLDPGYLPADYPDGVYHPGGGQVSRGFHGGGGYFSNPHGSMLDDGGYESPYNQNPYRYRLPRPPSDPRLVRAFNNPPRCRNCGCHP